MKRKNKEILSKNVNLRLTSYDLSLIEVEAEELGVGKADVLRTAWREYLKQKEISSLLSGVEQRLTKKTFEIVVAVAGLDDNERQISLQKFKRRMREEIRR